MGKDVNWFERSLDFVGKINNRFAKFVSKVDRHVDTTFANYGGNWVKKTLGISEFNSFSRNFSRASMAYTPYMYMKFECANQWDNGKMDMAAERLIDGVTHFKPSEFNAGAKEVWRSILHKPLTDPKREAEAQRRLLLDDSPPDVGTETQAQVDERQKEKLSWKSRLISGKPDAASDKHAKTQRENYVGSLQPQKMSFAEQEEMRKILEEVQPPSNLRH
jgi:hypothetical protein